MILKEYNISQEVQEKVLLDLLNNTTTASILSIPGIYEILNDHWNNEIIEHFDREYIKEMWDEVICGNCGFKWNATKRNDVFEFCPDCGEKHNLKGFFHENYKYEIRLIKSLNLFHIYTEDDILRIVDSDPYADKSYYKEMKMPFEVKEKPGDKLFIADLPLNTKHYLINLLKP